MMRSPHHVRPTPCDVLPLTTLRAGGGLAFVSLDHIRELIEVRGATFRRLQELSLSFYSKKQTGVLITRVNQDTEQMHRLLVDFIPYGINMILTVVGTLVLLFYLSWLLTCCVLLPVIGMILFIRLESPLAFLTCSVISFLRGVTSMQEGST